MTSLNKAMHRDRKISRRKSIRLSNNDDRKSNKKNKDIQRKKQREIKNLIQNGDFGS
jgi:hypothetical protein